MLLIVKIYLHLFFVDSSVKWYFVDYKLYSLLKKDWKRHMPGQKINLPLRQ